jgi:uncharacterized protein (TIGR00369 family)
MLNWERKLEAIDTSQESFDNCFACGVDNPFGLKLEFEQDGDSARAEFTISEHYEGWYGHVHGGILCTILDEAMAYTFFPKTKGVTTRVEVRFRRPAPTGVPMVATARLTDRTRKLLTTEATIALKDGTVIAEGTGQAYVIYDDKLSRGGDCDPQPPGLPQP